MRALRPNRLRIAGTIFLKFNPVYNHPAYGQTQVASSLIFWRKNALSQNCPLQSVIGFAGLWVKEKRGVTKPSGWRFVRTSSLKAFQDRD